MEAYTYSQWQSMGYQVRIGEKALLLNDAGQKVFTAKQVTAIYRPRQIYSKFTKKKK